MPGKTKLELTWLGKENRPRLEPRILLEEPGKSYHAKTRIAGQDNFDNRLIFGDNLLALKALEQEFTGKVKCIYIDPPYNTGAALEHYDDGIEHSLWLSLMRERLLILSSLLRPDGLIFVHIDDSEGAYLKALMDEVFGRDKYLVTFYVQVRYPEKTLKQDMLFNKVIEQIHCYLGRDNPVIFQPREEYDIGKFCWYFEEIGAPRKIELGGKAVEIFEPSAYRIREADPSHLGFKEIWATGAILDGNSSGRFFRDYLQGRAAEDGLGALYKVQGIGDDDFDYRYFTGPKRATATKGKYYQGVPSRVTAGDNEKKITISNFMDLADAFGNCRHEGGVEFRSGKKPEVLLRQLLELTTAPGDLVLDSFAGSGTTGAVAHKMGRRWIMVELAEHCHTHIIPRLQSVISGSDDTGITNAVGWKGGGGFRYFRMAPSLLESDKFGNWIISKQFNPTMLAEAMCKLEGFTYSPSESEYWKHGYSTEQDFIYVTTQTLARDQLQKLSEDVGENRSLLVCCSAFRVKDVSQFPNLTVKKIPKMVLNRCEWGHDDYSLEIEDLPVLTTEFAVEGELTPARRNGKKDKNNSSLSLFSASGSETSK
jgi:adenine-specific DNA-methyltransferase